MRKRAKIRVAIFFLLFSTAPFCICHGADLYIYHQDVVQGDSILIVSHQGKTILIDGGNDEMGTKKVIRFLQSLGIDSIDYLVTTQYDSDLIGQPKKFQGGYTYEQDILRRCGPFDL